MLDLLAILGRGIYKKSPDGPWVPTDDLEICDEKGAHLLMREPEDDENPRSLIGGSRLNLEAGQELVDIHCPRVVVCAYGDRAAHLKNIDAPSESMVLSDTLCEIMTGVAGARISPQIRVWTKEMSREGPVNTNMELDNVMRLALTENLRRIGIVTVAVHMPRTMFFAKNHLKNNQRYRENLKLDFFTSEEVLVAVNPEIYARRVARLYASKSFQRNAVRELSGIQAILDGKYAPVISIA